MSTLATEEQIEQVVIESLESFGAERGADQPRGRRSRRSTIDSLDLAELSQIIDEQFGVELTGADVAEIKTVGDASGSIASRL